MAFGTCKVHQDGKFCFKVRVSATEHIQGVPIIPVFHVCPIPGNCEVLLRDEPIFEGRQDGGQIKMSWMAS